MDKRQQDDITNAGIDISLLASLVAELNIACRNFRSYPQNHPLIAISLNKVIGIYDRLLSGDTEIVIGVTRDALMVKNVLLDKKNLVFRDFAKTLFEHGIGVLLLHRGLSADELRNFNRILCLKRDEVRKQGGISTLWEQAEITSLAIKPIRYDLFRVSENPLGMTWEGEQPSRGLWERFVLTLVYHTTVGCEISKLVSSENDDDEIDPRLLADILNRQMFSLNDDPGADLSTTAISSFAELTRHQTGSSVDTDISFEKLGIFISSLNPELRRKFLASSFDIDNISNVTLAEEILPRLSASTVEETLEDIRQNRFMVPPAIIKILQKLSLHADRQKPDTTANRVDEAEINQKIRNIFREHAVEDFIPDTYREKLKKKVSLDQSRQPAQIVVEDLMNTLDNHCIENHISDIILQIIVQDDDPAQTNLLVSNLVDIYFYLLQTGDYDQIIHLIAQGDTSEIPLVVRDSLRHYFASRKFMDEVLVGLTTWGKTKYDAITRLIRIIGEPFIEVLLEHLIDEESLSLRRFLMDRIQEFGELARGTIIAHLYDNRWYVLRNLIIMLRQLDDITVLEHVRPLLSNANQRVRQEALRCCLQFRDPAAERQLLYDMDSADRETQLSAINLVEKSRSVDVFRKLLAVIAKPGLSSIECELKSAAVHSLAEIGKAEALPELAKVLATKKLLNAQQLSMLKIDIVRSLSHYPPTVALPILTKLAVGSGEIARQAIVSLKMMTEKAS